MKVLVNLWEMGEFPWLAPSKPGEDDRRTIEVPDDLHERLVEAHEEFCAGLSEVHVQCVEILDAPDPYPVWLEVGWTDDWDRTDAWIARCSRGGCRTVTTVHREGWGGEDQARYSRCSSSGLEKEATRRPGMPRAYRGRNTTRSGHGPQRKSRINPARKARGHHVPPNTSPVERMADER